ncbi:MAG TPA: hypothetical protein VGD41_15115 [Pyrinomonadaceae bacterium]
MRKIILTISIFVLLIGVGYASVRFGKAKPAFKPHTIVYRVTSYDESSKPIRTDILVRQVFVDGSWTHTQVQQDGTVNHTKGQLTGPFTERASDADLPEHLAYKYVAVPGHDSSAWISPDLQDFLMFTALRENGSKVSMMEAVNITTP